MMEIKFSQSSIRVGINHVASVSSSREQTQDTKNDFLACADGSAEPKAGKSAPRRVDLLV